MSLVLRKKCQPLLDSNSLGSTHIDIDPNSKQLVIAGECGKTVVSVKGITFTRLPPSLAEIAYAAELLDTFLLKHGVDIGTYIIAKTKFNQKTIITQKSEEGFNIEHGARYSSYNKADVSVDWMDGKVKIKHYPTKKDYVVSLPELIKDTATLTDYQYDSVLAKKAKEYMKKYISYKDEQKVLEKMMNKLSVCDI